MIENTVRHGVVEDIDVHVDATGDAGWPVVLIEVDHLRLSWLRSERQTDVGLLPATHAAIPGSELHVIARAPRGCNIGHPDEWNAVLLTFHAKRTM